MEKIHSLAQLFHDPIIVFGAYVLKLNTLYVMNMGVEMVWYTHHWSIMCQSGLHSIKMILCYTEKC